MGKGVHREGSKYHHDGTVIFVTCYAANDDLL